MLYRFTQFIETRTKTDSNKLKDEKSFFKGVVTSEIGSESFGKSSNPPPSPAINHLRRW